MAHNYLVTAQRATVVSHSHCGYFNNEHELNTILIRGNNIEVYTLSADDSLEKINELPFYGRIIQSLIFRPPRCTTDHLFLLTQSFSFCIIASDPSTNQIITKASGQLKEENASIKCTSLSLISVDPTQQNIVVHIYKGEVLLIELDEFGKLRQRSRAEKIMIHELEILSLTFLHSTHDHITSTTSTADASSNSMLIDDAHEENDNNHESNLATTATSSTTSDLSTPLMPSNTSSSPKSKAAQAIKSKLSKLKSSKMGEKIVRLKRSRSANTNSESKSMDTNELLENEEKEAFTAAKYKLFLCVLYQDYRKGRHIKTYYLNTALHELQDGPWDTLMVEEGCNKLITVPPPLNGVMFVGQYSIAYRNGDNCQRVQVPDGDLSCYDAIINKRRTADDEDSEMNQEFVNGTRWLIGDALNQSLNLLEISYNEQYKVSHLQFNKLGEIVSPSTISYICSGLTLIGSTVGDSQFIEIHSDRNWRKKREQEENDEDDEDDDIAMDTDAIDNKMADSEIEDGYIEVLDEFTNLGPIVDLVSVDLERQGQCQLVTCSGVGRDGSLRVIKNGIGIEEVAEIEMEGIQGLWGLKESSCSVYDKYLVTSFISETRVLAMTEEGLEEMEMLGLNELIRSVHCGNMCNDSFCQIGEMEINVVDLASDEFALKHKWKCADHLKINSCATNEVQLLCALSNGNLFLLELVANEIVCIKSIQLEHEISCVALSPTFESVNANKSLYAAVGVWKDYSIRILSIPDLTVLLKLPLETDIVPRSILITNFASAKDEYLFIGMGDGSLCEVKLGIKLARSTSVDHMMCISHIELIKQKSIPLGTQPVRLVPFKCNAISYIFCGCDRPTVIYLMNARMFYANVNLPEINYVTEFSAKDFTDCLAMSCVGNLMIGQMDDVQKLHITKIPLYEQPRRIAYNPHANCYLLASQTILNKATNYFHPAYNQTVYKLTLRDGHNIEDVTYTKILDPYWNVTKIISHRFQCDPHVTYFIITSCLAKPHEKSPSQGKVQVAIVINDNDNNTRLKIVHNKLFRGDPTCVRGIGEDYLLVGVRSKIQLFRWMLTTGNNLRDDDEAEAYPFSLHHLHTIHNNTFVLDIKVAGDFFIVVDLMKSISMFLLQNTGHQEANENKLQMIDGTLINDGTNADPQHRKEQYAATVTEVARDYDPSWMKCGEMYNDQYLVGIDSFCNLFILKRNIDSLNEEERGRLDVVCRIHCGDDINTICHGSLVMDVPHETVDQSHESHESSHKTVADKIEMDQDEEDDDDVEEEEKKQKKAVRSQYNLSALRATDLRKCVFGTIDGSIGVLISIPYLRYEVLQKLEKSLRKYVQGLGGLEHEQWRKFKNQTEGKPAVGFLDGDLIETYLNLTNQQQIQIADDMKIENQSLMKIVEEMNRLH